MSKGQSRRSVDSETDTIYVNVSADLGRRIRDLAARERRTLKGQLEVLLERGLAVTETLADKTEIKSDKFGSTPELVA